uniref:Uncharacterized protein n=1 Tax=Candida gigantensis TaxID=271359 RepID=S5TFD9_9ASCO|nr:hypothetical protein [Candida gigantensis]YP_008475265.1 hypothetical protein [Candida gigantensis]AGS44584.1 hypothetical protein [Candida gigantensis]AGS44585.1 hypothetical protein [Candida gigantensis]
MEVSWLSKGSWDGQSLAPLSLRSTMTALPVKSSLARPEGGHVSAYLTGPSIPQSSQFTFKVSSVYDEMSSHWLRSTHALESMLMSPTEGRASAIYATPMLLG